MEDWALDPPEALRRAHRLEGRGRGALPPGARCLRVPGALVIVPAGPATGTLLWWHGGGFVAGHPLRAAAPAAWIAGAAGLRAVLPTWPLAPEARWPAQARHARAWCARLSPAAVGGDSAGGALALSCADRTGALVLAYPALGAAPGPAARRWGTAANGLEPRAVRAMYARLGVPDLAARWPPGLPDCLLVTGDREPLAADARLLAGLGRVERHVVPGAGHGFIRDAGRDPDATAAAQVAGRWLADAMRPRPGGTAGGRA